MSAPPRSVKACHGPIHSLTTRIGGSNMTISRTNSLDLGLEINLAAKAEDAFAIAYRLSDVPGHEVWNDGQHSQRPAEPRSTFQIVDLRVDTRAHVDASFDFLLIHIPRLALVALADSNNVPPIDWIATQASDPKRDPVLEGLLPSILHLLSHPDVHHRLVREHLMLTLLSHVVARYGGMTLRRETGGGLAPWQVRRAKEVLGDDLGTNVSLTDLARHCALSPSHFSRAFKASTGLSPFAWLQRHRVERAKEMLRNGNVSLAEIAISCGFADQSHLGRLFARQVGTPPGSWQRAHRSGPIKQQYCSKNSAGVRSAPGCAR
jgi:AraC family transcriptional regulator